jgi:phosphate transport system substrate-binding protein
MKTSSSIRRCKVLAVISIFGFLPLGSTAFAAEKLTLFAAGSTFIYPILAKWRTEYAKTHPGVQVSYEPVGSGHGIGRTLAGTVDFGVSDGPVSDAQMEHAKLMQLSVVVGAVVPSY